MTQSQSNAFSRLVTKRCSDMAVRLTVGKNISRPFRLSNACNGTTCNISFDFIGQNLLPNPRKRAPAVQNSQRTDENRMRSPGASNNSP